MAFLNPAPVPTPDSAPFWEAANRGELLVKTCEDCGRAHCYPRPNCPFCASGRTVWRKASGRGTIQSHCHLRRVAEPYVLAYVTLEEGPTMMTNIVDCDPDSLRIGDAVTVRFIASADPAQSVPVFGP